MASFKTRARAVDMLGRQQISGIPTAISELFKNAHDAYAERVEVDYYRSDRLFVLRDDGLGMTREDFETRWLTLGTESKLGAAAGLALPPQATGKALRPVLGEKGIGRLAIAAIGPQLFILTRARRDGQLLDTVAAYIHWGIFSQPGIDLDEIEIPIRSFPDGRLPNAAEAAEMLNEFERNIAKLKYTSAADIAQFKADFDATRIDLAEIDRLVPDMSLAGEGHGTHFIILPAYQIFEADIDSGTITDASALERALLGFTNQMTPDHLSPVITAAFRDHATDESSRDIIGEGQFFTPKEFLSADHHFQGAFDEFGQFSGTVSIYGKASVPYRLEWTEAKGKKTQCGPFSVNIAYIQGRLAQTTVAVEEYGQLINKTDRYGGLYIYKNGIRILPYGQLNFDWLEIEKRRTMKASRYFFSHRRMFGVVEIDQDRNKALSEKAGREGFRENKAYREFRDILKNMFLSLAADFFNEDGAYGQDFIEIRAELVRSEEARKKQEAQSSAKRRKLTTELTKFFEAYENKEPEREAIELAGRLQSELANAASIKDARRAAHEILNVEGRARQQLRLLEEKYRVARPKGFAINKKTERDYADHLFQYQQLQNSVFTVVQELLEGEVSQAAERARLELDRRVRVEHSLRELAAQAESVGRSERKDTIEALETVENLVKDKVRESVAQISDEVRDVLVEFNSIDFTDLEESEVITVRDRLENKIIEVKDRKQELLRAIRAQLEAVNFTGDIGTLDQVAALEQQVMTMAERADLELQLSQLGMAIEVINHEFDASVKSIRDGLRDLKTWADANQKLNVIYQDLRLNFEHLDGYLALFTPLQRRLYRQAVSITGVEITAYLNNLFGPRFERHGVTLRPTDAFNHHQVTGYPSSFYPVFVNLIDNAVFWLSNSPLPRIIELDADHSAFLVSNSGPEILGSRLDFIFQSGVTYKPGGRGLGLAISREVLAKIGYSIQVDAVPRPEMGVTFRIAPAN